MTEVCIVATKTSKLNLYGTSLTLEVGRCLIVHIMAMIMYNVIILYINMKNLDTIYVY